MECYNCIAALDLSFLTRVHTQEEDFSNHYNISTLYVCTLYVIHFNRVCYPDIHVPPIYKKDAKKRQDFFVCKMCVHEDIAVLMFLCTQVVTCNDNPNSWCY